jgi:hypothetical protein
VAAVYPGSGGVVYPPGGGSAWIPLAVVLLVIIGCLPPTVAWTIQWRRSARRPAVVDYRPGAAPQKSPRQRGHTVTGTRAAVIIALEIVALVAAGAALASQSDLVLRAPTPAAMACASYGTWLLAQPEAGPPRRDPTLLADATQEARSGQLGDDLLTLQSDVAIAVAEPSEELSLVAEANVLADMNQVDRDCKN